MFLVMDGIAGSGHYASFGPGDQNSANTGDAFFGLSEFVRVLESRFFPRFKGTKAHRDTYVNGAADIEHFKFDAVDLSAYDEIWLFGVAVTGGTANSRYKEGCHGTTMVNVLGQAANTLLVENLLRLTRRILSWTLFFLTCRSAITVNKS